MRTNCSLFFFVLLLFAYSASAQIRSEMIRGVTLEDLAGADNNTIAQLVQSFQFLKTPQKKKYR